MLRPCPMRICACNLRAFLQQMRTAPAVEPAPEHATSLLMRLRRAVPAVMAGAAAAGPGAVDHSLRARGGWVAVEMRAAPGPGHIYPKLQLIIERASSKLDVDCAVGICHTAKGRLSSTSSGCSSTKGRRRSRRTANAGRGLLWRCCKCHFKPDFALPCKRQRRRFDGSLAAPSSKPRF